MTQTWNFSVVLKKKATIEQKENFSRYPENFRKNDREDLSRFEKKRDSLLEPSRIWVYSVFLIHQQFAPIFFHT